jgi:DNA repair protein RecN (Recombination protein N)
MALRRLTLREFVIVSELDIEFSGGFTVLTGETGAGKSILIEALQFALGERADSMSVREGAARAEVSAEFDAPGWLAPWFDAAGFELADALLLRRTVDNQGRSRGWINGSAATAAQLRELGAQLLDIHGQHAWQSLTRPESVRALLDAYAGLPGGVLDAAWQRWREAQQRLEQARAAQASLQQERERLAWQIGELSKLAPGSDEWEGLNFEHMRLSHSQALLDAAQQALAMLGGDESGAPSALSALAQARQALTAQQHLEPAFGAICEALSSSLAAADDVSHSLRQYLGKNEPDPQRLLELDARVALWLSLARRYKRQPQDLAAALHGWRLELAALEASADLLALENAQKEAQKLFLTEAAAVSKRRQAAAPQLSRSITAAMQGLGMAGGRFDVELQALVQPAAFGLESALFLVSGHDGGQLRPVARVASGGELSRIALAIAITTSRSDAGPPQGGSAPSGGSAVHEVTSVGAVSGGAPTLIFDEVDAGIGGAVAEVVGRLLKQLGRDRQVLAVTHLPQVAACADRHLLVSKQIGAQGVACQVAAVLGEQRVAEVARMLGGERLSSTTLAHAKEMLGKNGLIRSDVIPGLTGNP